MNGTRICSIEGCEKTSKVRGWCVMHYTRWKRKGSPHAEPEHPPYPIQSGDRFGRLTVTGKPEAGPGWTAICDCGTEVTYPALRLVSGRVVSCGCRRREGSPKAALVGYNTAHIRVVKSRGPASSHQCVDCGGQAHHWSYDHSDPGELHGHHRKGGPIFPYSLDIERYQPRCYSCHVRFDQ